MTVISVIGGLCLILGTVICIIGGIGLLKFPNFFARVHAASIPDTLGAGLCLVGMIILSFTLLEHGDYTLKQVILICIKLFFIGVFIFVTSPISGHALTKAAFKNGLAGDIEPINEGKDTPPVDSTSQEADNKEVSS